MRNAVILPANELSDSEVFAPAFKTGMRVYVSATFLTSLPLVLTVNNQHPDIRARYENSNNIAAVNMRVAEKLEIDFTGDLVYIEPIEEENK